MTVSFGLEDKTEIERLPADEIERVVMSALKQRLADARWLADQIQGQKSEAFLADILPATKKLCAQKDAPKGEALPQIFLGIIDPIDLQRDWPIISVNIATLAEPDAALPSVPADYKSLSKDGRTDALNRLSSQPMMRLNRIEPSLR